MNIPNVLTLFRVVMIPFFVLAFLGDSISNWIAFFIFIIAAITDALDGYIARKQNIVTDFGKLMDPLADKLMVMAAFVCFTAVGILHPAVTIIILAREFLVTGLRGIASSKGRVIAADILGKIKTVSQDVTVIIILFWQAVSGKPGILEIIARAGIWIMTIFTVVSAINYCLKNSDIFKTEKNNE